MLAVDMVLAFQSASPAARGAMASGRLGAGLGPYVIAYLVGTLLQHLRRKLRLPGSSRRRPVGVSRRPPKVNQDSPDAEGALGAANLQQLATVYASSCHPMLEFARFHGKLCRSLLAQMSEFAAID